MAPPTPLTARGIAAKCSKVVANLAAPKASPSRHDILPHWQELKPKNSSSLATKKGTEGGRGGQADATGRRAGLLRIRRAARKPRNPNMLRGRKLRTPAVRIAPKEGGLHLPLSH